MNNASSYSAHMSRLGDICPPASGAYQIFRFGEYTRKVQSHLFGDVGETTNQRVFSKESTNQNILIPPTLV